MRECGNRRTRMTRIQMSDSYLYGGVVTQATSAAGVKGVLLRSPSGPMIFRVYRDGHEFTDYEIRHDELAVTIDPEELAMFYRDGDRDVLDHRPEVLGLKRSDS
ncbi:MAG: hypothetical protein JWM02_3641 [Frankiales bacterium]|nr:hypothetical protein [Frankiales bacterium]